MKILIIGASRGVGLDAVKQAVVAGYAVRAFARSANKIALCDPKLEKQSGSALQLNDVSSTLMGVDAVILTLGISVGPDMVFGPVHLFSDATRIIVSAMKRAGVILGTVGDCSNCELPQPRGRDPDRRQDRHLKPRRDLGIELG
jgi:putative NADH-flavin reductase